jgi:Uma2 family endonuclease
MTTRSADAASTSNLTDVFYPESDGMPLPDGEFQSPLFREIVGTLETYFNDRPNAHVNGNTFIYYEQGNPRRFVSPDCYVVFDISMESIERNNTYLIWEMGKPPDFVMEIGSPSTATTDLVNKRELYADLGIGEYWRFDSTGGDFYREPLVGERLVDGEYQRLEMRRETDGSVWAHSDALNLDLWWTDGELRYWDPLRSVWLLTHQEEKNARLAAEARVAGLEAELRRLRGE